MQQKKLLMISTDRKIFQEGSAVRARQAEYAKGWAEVHILVFDDARSLNGETVIAPNCWAYPIQSRAKILHPFGTMKLGKFLVVKRGITDVTCQDPFLTAMAGIGLKKDFPQVRLEMQVHSDIGSTYFTYSFGNKIRKSLALSYLPKADHVRVVSGKIRDFLVEKLGTPDSKIEVRPIFVDTEKIKTAPVIETADLRKKYPQFGKIVLVASRLEKEKNVALAISSWKKITEKAPSAGLVIVGSGSELATLKSMVTDLGLNTTVVFEGWADQATLYSYYKTVDVFVNTSLFEGYGMTLVEAHAAGCPIVSTDVGVAKEVGAIIAAWDESDVADKVASVLV
ncbi:MAG: glycosyltransferase [Patescibacteria group bacterium]